MYRHIFIWCLIFVGLPCLRSYANGQIRENVCKPENIVLGKSCSFKPAPNYKLCADSEDSKQLTDGKICNENNMMWCQKGAVGWDGANPAYITIDLGKNMPIGGIAIHTAARRPSTVKWPTFVMIFVGDKEGQYYWAGELFDLCDKDDRPDSDQYLTRWFRTDKLQTHGRYVCLAILGNPYYIVLDEIEIHAGRPEFLQQSRGKLLNGTLDSNISPLMLEMGILRRQKADFATLRSKVQTSAVAEKDRDELIFRLDVVRRQIKLTTISDPDNFRTILPLGTPHRELFDIQAKLWEKMRLPDLAIWSSGLWDSLNPFDDPPVNSKTRVSVDMMTNEYRAGAINLSNTTQKPIDVELQITGLPGGTNPNCIQVHEVQWTDTYNSGVVASALPDARQVANNYIFEVIPGLTRQVWFTFHPTDLKPGKYEGQILLKWGDKTSQIPLVMTVYPLRFPDQPTLHFGGWDYIMRGGFGKTITDGNRAQFLSLLWTHFVDSSWNNENMFPAGQYDQKGHLIKEPDTSAFDLWLKYWPNARRYYVFMSVKQSFASFPMSTPEFQTAVKNWMTFWMTHAHEKGIKSDQLYLLLVDEPRSAEQDETFNAWIKPVRQAGTGVKIWEDPRHPQPKGELLNLCDAVCLNRPDFLTYDSKTCGNYLDKLRNVELQLYSCSGPSMGLDPYAYYRMQAWSCYKTGALSTNFWSFSDGSSWNEFKPRTNFCPFFIDTETVTTAKQFEACREGIEDYEYFVMLKNAINHAEKNGVDPAVLAQAERLLKNSLDQVLKAGTSKSLQWNEKINRKLADETRVQILQLLSVLEKSGNKN